MDQPKQIPKYPTHAVKMRDNWDGEGDIIFTFAFEHEGQFFHHEPGAMHGSPLLQYKGDEIISVWPLS